MNLTFHSVCCCCCCCCALGFESGLRDKWHRPSDTLPIHIDLPRLISKISVTLRGEKVWPSPEELAEFEKPSDGLPGSTRGTAYVFKNSNNNYNYKRNHFASISLSTFTALSLFPLYLSPITHSVPHSLTHCSSTPTDALIVSLLMALARVLETEALAEKIGEQAQQDFMRESHTVCVGVFVSAYMLWHVLWLRKQMTEWVSKRGSVVVWCVVCVSVWMFWCWNVANMAFTCYHCCCTSSLLYLSLSIFLSAAWY